MRYGFPTLLIVAGLLIPIGLRAAEPDTSALDEKTLKSAGLSTDGSALLEFFKKRTLADNTREQVAALIRKLGDDDFGVREKAVEDLVGVGSPAVPLLRQALKSPDMEVVRRAEKCLERLDKIAGPAVSVAAIRTLARKKPEGVTGVLLGYVPFADDETVSDTLKAALKELAIRDGQPDKALLAALTDKLALRRSAAAEALIRAGNKDHWEAPRKLLDDPDATVRLDVALALFDQKQDDSVPALIKLLAELPVDQGWKAEDTLVLLAGEKAPTLGLGRDGAARKKCMEEWQKWYEANKKDIDLKKFDPMKQLLGYTLIVFMEQAKAQEGKVTEIDREGKPRWAIANLQYPVDAQVVGNDRVLITEYRARKVTERDFKGDIKWEKALNTYPTGAQRVSDGNTFIYTRNQFMEVDKDGKELFTIARNNDIVQAAVKLRNGEIGFVNSAGNYIRMDTKGNELKSFPVGTMYTYGAIDVAANGKVLVPQYQQSKVVEFDADGKQLWEAAVQNPTAVFRLPNGNVLVTALSGQLIIELDRAGKKIWDYKVEGRPLRAKRR